VPAVVRGGRFEAEEEAVVTAILERAREVLSEILGRMGIEASVEATETDERINLEVKGPDSGLIIGKKGMTLDALQHLVAKVVFHGKDGPIEGGKPIQVDTEGYRARRVESLEAMARRLSEKVVATRRPIEVDPMTPADRRVIHMALANTPGVTTRSEGEGADRRLVIFPAPEKA
jgi:spoIIIJ-associated protein